MNNLVHINNIELRVTEFKGQRIVTLRDIDLIHNRPDGTAKRNFIANKDKFIEGEDYFIITPSLKNEFRTLEIPNRGITAITESGYLMLAKSFQDELAWEVQRKLVNTYFRVRQAMSYEDMIIMQAQSMKELKADVQENARRIDKLNDETYVTPEQKNALQVARNKRIIDLIGYKTKAYNDRSFRNRVYAELGRQYKNYFKISSYGYTLKNHFDEAIQVIESYNLSMNLNMELKKLAEKASA